MEQFTKEESNQLHQKYGTDWICPYCHSSMYVVMKLIKHPKADKKKFPCIFKCLLCEKEETYWVKVEEKWLVKTEVN